MSDHNQPPSQPSHTYRIRRVCITPPLGGFRSSIARQPRGCQYRTLRLRKTLGQMCFQHRHCSDCVDIDHGKSAQAGVKYTVVVVHGTARRLSTPPVVAGAVCAPNPKRNWVRGDDALAPCCASNPHCGRARPVRYPIHVATTDGCVFFYFAVSLED